MSLCCVDISSLSVLKSSSTSSIRILLNSLRGIFIWSSLFCIVNTISFDSLSYLPPVITCSRGKFILTTSALSALVKVKSPVVPLYSTLVNAPPKVVRRFRKFSDSLDSITSPFLILAVVIASLTILEVPTTLSAISVLPMLPGYICVTPAVSIDTAGVTHIYPGSIGNTDIADSVVGTSKIVNDAITTAKIKNGDVIESKLSENLRNRLTTFGGAFTNVEYNGTTGDLTFTKAESADVVKINLPLEQVITGGRYDKESNEIVFTIQNSDDQIKIPLNEFSKILIDDVEEDFNTLKEEISTQHKDITDSINAVRDSIFEVQIAPPLERLMNAMVLPAPTLSVLANIE